ncbi:hypothetical protein [Neoroseomonas rubea]|uniref:hypothetical protein n=1 Tax=Neoroseomonas rubea TaxID=2748666 RepID=UPI0018DEF70E|nr:hypothetical protein [Roseomonas rubea]
MRAVRWTLALSLLAAGCGAPRAPELDVESQWSDAMRRLGLFAFYPATEDVRPGDIYLLVPPPSGLSPWWGRQETALVPWARPDHDGSRFSLLRMASLGPLPARPRTSPDPMTALDHLRAQQEERFRIQPLPREEDKPAEGERRQPGQPPRGRITDAPPADAPYHLGHADQASLPLRLQRSAIPALTVARLTEAQLGAAGIFGNFAGNLGVSTSSEVALTIALRDVQELNLEAWRTIALYEAHAHATLRDRVGPNEMLLWLAALRGGRNWRYDLVDEACNGDVDELRDQGVQVAVVTRVIYAGGIEYSFSRRAATAVQAALDLQGALAQNVRQPPQVPSVVVNNNGAGAPRPDSQSQNQTPGQTTPAAQIRDALAARLAGLTGVTSGENARAGVRTSLGIGTFGSLSLIETFNRPIAVGAGSRLVLAFHHVLAGEEAPGARGTPQLNARFREAEAFCLAHFRMRGRQDFDRDALWRAMARNDAPAPSTERSSLLDGGGPISGLRELGPRASAAAAPAAIARNPRDTPERVLRAP